MDSQNLSGLEKGEMARKSYLRDVWKVLNSSCLWNELPTDGINHIPQGFQSYGAEQILVLGPKKYQARPDLVPMGYSYYPHR